MIYKMAKREILFNFSLIFLVLIISSYLFYGTVWAVFLLSPFGIIIFKYRRKKILKKKKENLEIQFKDMLISISDALKTGYSVQNALKESYRDMISTYGYESLICVEVRLMLSRIKLNVNEEKVFQDFAERTGLRNAVLFSRIFSVAKRTGGNMTEVIRNVTENIVIKENVKEEIEVSIAEKKLEQRIMTVIPIFLILYVKLMSPGFLDVMYESILGRVIMTVCVGLYAAAFIWGNKIIEMEVEY